VAAQLEMARFENQPDIQRRLTVKPGTGTGTTSSGSGRQRIGRSYLNRSSYVYPWANDLLYTHGSEPPPRDQEQQARPNAPVEARVALKNNGSPNRWRTSKFQPLPNGKCRLDCAHDALPAPSDGPVTVSISSRAPT
jgi:hypothetical protein